MHVLFFRYGIALIIAGVVVSCTPDTPAPAMIVQAQAEVLTPPPADTAPPQSRKYRAALTREARLVWGLDAPIPMLAAQVQQESNFNPAARSPVGATGLTQFMPTTADWIAEKYPELGPAQPTNPDWALRAQSRYMRHLYDRESGATECDRHAFSLVGYNGGSGWTIKDRARAATNGLDSQRYWDNVEKINAGRNVAAWTENRGYPRRIVYVLQSAYSGWGRMVCFT